MNNTLTTRGGVVDVPPAKPDSSLPRILLVDDQPARLLTYEAVLEGVGVSCTRALSGTEALHKLLLEEFAVIVLDVQMPELDGFETARHIREREYCFLDLLARQAADPDGMLARIQPMMERQMAHTVRLVDDLLDVSRITSGRIELVRAPATIESIVTGAVDAHRDQIEAGGFEFVLRIDEPARAIHVDGTRLSNWTRTFRWRRDSIST